jgi:hypothetical protein
MIRTFAFAAVVAPSANLYAQETSSVPLRDEEFLMKAYCEGMAEVAKSKLACEKATQWIISAANSITEAFYADTACNRTFLPSIAKQGTP